MATYLLHINFPVYIVTIGRYWETQIMKIGIVGAGNIGGTAASCLQTPVTR